MMKRIWRLIATMFILIFFSACQHDCPPWEKINFIIYNGNLYYETYDDGELYRLDLKTDDNQKLKSNGSLFETNGKLYLFKDESINLWNDESLEKLGAAPEFNTGTLIGIVGTTYYYADWADICYWNYETSEKGIIHHYSSAVYNNQFVLDGEYIFYIDLGRLYKMHIPDGTYTKISDDTVTDIENYNGVLYYAVDNPSETITNVDGTHTFYDNGYGYYTYVDGETTCLIEVESSLNNGNFTISDGHIWAVGNSKRDVYDNRALYSYDIVNGTVDIITLSEGVEIDGAIVSDDDYIVFADEYGRDVWKYDISARTLKRLFSD